MDAKKALERLIEGNSRFAGGKPEAPRRDNRRLSETAPGQSPFAVILTCADSRVPPEIIFDEGIGDLFVIRVAGNIVDDLVIGSIEYAAGHLAVPLVVVLGHSDCGAVKAALSGCDPHGHTGSFIEEIRTVIRRMEGTDPDSLVEANIENTVAVLRESGPVLKALHEEGNLLIIGARYDLVTGKVVFFKY
ncbi:MAG: carbonic anhydrase [Candidatus Krumholzibacteriota bacterium]|nr:carbonic anhydrase [Candidatus Krumholzibacteriota bacterium]